tara:strand:- start:958 stop:1359 length:402 start_codon:yes stop_codon:yes gene_type:complete
LKKEEVPQDKSFLKEEHGKELYYALDENGNYTTALSSGWEAKTIALGNALQDIEERIADAKQRVLDHKTSPIEYHMERCRMDPQVLSSYVGMWQWRVKRHFKPAVFKRLNEKTLQKYADVFDIDLVALKNIAP